MNHIDRIERALEAGRKAVTIEALAGVLDPAWVEEETREVGSRDRKLPAPLVVWFVVLLGVFRNLSYENVLAKLADTWLGRRFWREGATPGRSAIPGARRRVGIAPLKRLFERTAGSWTHGSRGRIVAGRRVVGLDGSSYKVPDTRENDAAFGRPGANRGRAAFPQLRLVKLVDVETRLICDAEYGPYRDGELTIARRLLPRIEAGSLVLLDRGFHAYDFLFALKNDQCADFVVRIKERTRCEVVEILAVGDELIDVEIHSSLRRSEPRLGKSWRLRRITYRMGKKVVRLLTTILDPRVLPRDDVAQLYHERWECETTIDEIKTHLCGCTTVNRPVVFRSQAPTDVEQELYGLLIAYNAIRKLMATAAERADLEPRRLSFVACVERIREAVPAMGAARTEHLPRLYRLLLRKLVDIVVAPRPGRHGPRAVKIKMSKFRLRTRRAA